MSTTSFIIDENYVITAITIDGITVNCSLQIDEDWVPYVDSYITNNSGSSITGVCVGDEESDRLVASGDISVIQYEEIFPPDGHIIPAPEVNLVYMGTKYNYIKVWDGTVWLTDRAIGNKLFDTDGDGHLNYTINYLPISIQFIQVNETDYSVMSTSMVYTADHNGTWAIYDDGHWERLDNKQSNEVEG